MERAGNARCDDSSETPEGLVAKLAMIAPAYADDALEATYDGILVSAALDAQALALKAGEARTRTPWQDLQHARQSVGDVALQAASLLAPAVGMLLAATNRRAVFDPTTSAASNVRRRTRRWTC